MKTIKNLSIILVFLTSLFLGHNAFSQDSYIVDKGNSKLIWIGKKVTGEHFGTVQMSKGEFKVKEGILQSGSFEIDMTSIKCTDIEDAETNAKLLGHLTSDDFFGVTKFPTARLVIKSTEEIKKGSFKVTADLTIKDVTKSITFKAISKTGESDIKIFADITIDRTDFNISYGSGSLMDDVGDYAIFDDINLRVTIAGTK